MGAFAVSVTRVQAVNSTVDRIVGDGVSIDVPTRFLKVTEGDRLKLEVEQSFAPKGHPSADCVLCGTVYRSDAESSDISCGGLLCRVPTRLQADGSVYLLVSRSRRRRRTRE